MHALARFAGEPELIGDAFSLLLAPRFEKGTSLRFLDVLDAGLLGDVRLVGGALALFGNAGFLRPAMRFGQPRLVRLTLGCGFLCLPLHLGDARFFGTPLGFGNACLLGLLFFGDAALLRFALGARSFRQSLCLGYLLSGDAALVFEALFLGDALLFDVALQACRLGAAFSFGPAVHVRFLLQRFLGEALCIGACRLALGLDHLPLARLVGEPPRFRLLLGGAQHFSFIGGALRLGRLAFGSFRLLLGLGQRLGAHLCGLGFLGALRFLAGVGELFSQRVSGIIGGNCRLGAIHQADQRHGAHRATTEAISCRPHNVLAIQNRLGAGRPQVAAKARPDFANKAGGA